MKMIIVLLLFLISVIRSEDVTIDTTTSVMEIDEHFLSSGWEMWAFVDYLPKITNPVFRKIVSALGPGMVRVGGITCDFIQYTLPNQNHNSKKRQFWPDHEEDLSVANFETLVDFANATNLQLVFGLNEIHGRSCHVNGTQVCTGNWDTSNVEAFLTYLRDHKVGPIFAFELGNEITPSYAPHITIQENIDDYNTLNSIISKIWTDPKTRPPIYGPSTDYCNDDTAAFMQGTKSFLKGFSYHSYPGQSGSQLKTQLIDINWLKQNIVVQDVHAHSEICISTWEQIGKPIGMELWVTETNTAYDNAVGVMNAFYNGFWYLASLGQYAKTGVSRHSRWSLEGGDDDDTFRFVNISAPTFSVVSDYWVAVLYKRLIGTKVLQASSSFTQVLVYAHCGKTSGSVTLIVINPSSAPVPLNLMGLNSLQRNEFIFTADSLSSYVVKLNGKLLYLNSDGSLPSMDGVPGTGQPVLPPYSYGYLSFPNGGSICK